MWNDYNTSNPGKLHIVAANTHAETIATLNGSTWRTKFNPALTYFIADKTMLGNTYAQFGNGYVPMNVVIGGGNRIIYSDNDMPSTAIIDQAIMSLDIYVENAIATTEISLTQQAVIDLTNCFVTSNGQTIVYSVENVANASLVTASIAGNSLTLVANATTAGMTKVKIKATAGVIYGYHEFTVKIKDPNQIELLAADFETFPPAGWANTNWSKGSGGVVGSCAKAVYQPAGTKTLTTPAIALPANLTAKLEFDWKNNDIAKIVGHDSTFCEITSDNGTTWTKLGVLSSGSPQNTFIHVTKLLDEYKGQSIKLRWRYKTDGSGNAYGVGLDEVLISYVNGINETASPVDFSLLQNYPNPFNPSTTISFNLQSAADVKLTVYNQAGAEVSVITESRLNQGAHSFSFDGSKLNSGVYYYTLTANNQQKSGKMLLVK